MAPFCWPKVEQDIVLCKEITVQCPTKAETGRTLQFLSNLFTTENNPVKLNGWGCCEQSELLVIKYKSEERKALKREVKPLLVLFGQFMVSSFHGQIICSQIIPQGKSDHFKAYVVRLFHCSNENLLFQWKCKEKHPTF